MLCFTALCQANKHNKTAERGIVFTDKFIYKLDMKKHFKPMQRGIPFTDVSPSRHQKLLLKPVTELPTTMFWSGYQPLRFGQVTNHCVLVRLPTTVFWSGYQHCVFVRLPATTFWSGYQPLRFGQVTSHCVLVRLPTTAFWSGYQPLRFGQVILLQALYQPLNKHSPLNSASCT